MASIKQQTWAWSDFGVRDDAHPRGMRCTEASFLTRLQRLELSAPHKCLLEFAAGRGWLAAVQWLRQHGCSWDECACSAAAESGHLAVLQWVYHNNCPWNTWTCSGAASRGHLTVLQWARQQTPPCPWNEATCSYAAQGGHLMLLKWARQHGAPWDQHTCRLAAARGHLALLQWAHYNGAPWTTETTSYAMYGCCLTVYHWARQHGCPCDENDLDWNKEIVAAMTGSYLVLKAAAPPSIPPELLKNMVMMAHGVT